MTKIQREKARQEKSRQLFEKLAEVKNYKRYMMGINEKGDFYAKIFLSNGKVIKL